MEAHIYSVLIGSMVEDIRNSYALNNVLPIDEFEDKLYEFSSVEEAVEDPELELMYEEIIKHCPDFNNLEYWINFKTAMLTYDRSIRPEEVRRLEME